MVTDNVIFNVVPKSFRSGQAELYARSNGFDTPVAIGWKEICEWFGV